MTKYRVYALIVLIIGIAIGSFVYTSETGANSRFKFKYGLDLNGGTQLVYRANVDGIDQKDIPQSMNVLRQTIEKRINIFGVSEPVVSIETGSGFADQKDKNRLIVELPGVTDTKAAIASIGQTPFLEFKLPKEDLDADAIQEQLKLASTSPEKTKEIINSIYQSPVLTGGDLKRASLVFDPQSAVPVVSIEFNERGSQVFEDVTGAHIGKQLAIFLDGELISQPTIQQKISGGTAQINGDFKAEEARDLVNNLNFGALPVPIELISTQTIGATLGQQTLHTGALALVIALIAISVFMTLFYRLPGLIASVSLLIYTLIMLALFKTIPVVLTAAGIAGFVLSLGIAVDANVLIFERMKEELDKGNDLFTSVKNGFDRAWSSIRDGNITSIIAAVILYWFSDISLVKGFALVFGLGVIMSMINAMFISKSLMMGILRKDLGPISRFLYSKGLTNIKK